jgi:hypothetical protein
MNDGLTEDERSTLTHFTTRLIDAMVAMREAWMAADPENAHAIEIALAILVCQSHSTRRNLHLVRKVLGAGNGRVDELISNISVRVLDVGAMAGRLKGIIAASVELGRLDATKPVAEEIEAAAGACLLIFNETTEAPRADWTRSPIGRSLTTVKP